MLNFNEIETHPLEPFLPSAAKLLMLGSFPPPVNRWSMDFYYPNFQNDMWRIMGLIFFSDKEYFIRDKKFHQPSVEASVVKKALPFRTPHGKLFVPGVMPRISICKLSHH